MSDKEVHPLRCVSCGGLVGSLEEWMRPCADGAIYGLHHGCVDRGGWHFDEWRRLVRTGTVEERLARIEERLGPP